MSSMDQVFVKAFSRRRLAEPGRQHRHPLSQHDAEQHDAEQLDAEQLETTPSNDGVGSKSPLGSLELDRSVAGTAEVWFDSEVAQIARADQPRLDVPPPHVDRAGTAARAVTFERPVEGTPSGTRIRERVSPQEPGRDALSESDRKNRDVPLSPPDPMQHIHTAYAGAFADPSLIAASASLDDSVVISDKRPATSADNTIQSLRQSQAVTQIGNWSGVADAGSSASDAASFASKTSESVGRDVIEYSDRIDDDAVVEMRIDPPAPLAKSDPISAPASTYVPFQAVWEVDVFDVPTPVADLFFEGALFQQIAERMSDAVSSGLRTVLVTSTKPGEGRSCVAIGMAMAAAAAGIRVALVDADTEAPSLADELRLDLQYGWVDVIRRGLPIKEIAVQAVEDGVTLVPLMPSGVRPAATAFEMVQLIDLLTSNFELIILDGPTSMSPGLQQCAAKMDSAVIVRDVTRTDELAVCELSNQLQRAGVRGVGVVENFV